MGRVRGELDSFKNDLREFSVLFCGYLFGKTRLFAFRMERGKGVFVASLYKQRGKLSRKFMHSGMAGLAAFGFLVAPIVAEEFPGDSEVNPWDAPSSASVLSASASLSSTDFSGYRGEIIEYTVEEGDTVSSIAQKYGVSEDTIRWQNDLKSKDSIKIGQVLEILPLTGIAHKVKKGDTVHSIAKKYDIDPQGIVNYPFNSFTNDETFELAIGQIVIVPDGVMPTARPWSPSINRRQLTPDAGTVVASGQFVWPASGRITQRFVWYHKALDIANKSAPAILAADSGTVVVAGWPDGYGYGNRVVIDHGNGYKTLYAHLSRVYVVVGQTVGRGATIGRMGSTGRSTGTHLHFEVIRGGVYINPLSVLQ